MPPRAGDDTDAAHDAGLAAIEQELLSELKALRAGVPGACRRFDDATWRYVGQLRDRGIPPERVLDRVKQLIYGHLPWEPFRDPSHIDKVALPVITACIATCYARS